MIFRLLRKLKMKKKKIVNLSDIIIPKYQPLVNDKKHMHKIVDSGRAGTKSSFIAILAIWMIVASTYMQLLS